VPVAKAARILADDRKSYILPLTIVAAAAAVTATVTGDGEEGDLYTKGTVDAYIAAVIELWRV